MPEYQHKPVMVEAFRVGVHSYPRWFTSRLQDKRAGINPDGSIWFVSPAVAGVVSTLNKVKVGDYIINGEDGVLRQMAGDEFHAAYA